MISFTTVYTKMAKDINNVVFNIKIYANTFFIYLITLSFIWTFIVSLTLFHAEF